MLDSYKIKCLVNGINSNANIILDTVGDVCQIKFAMDEIILSVEAENFFFALIELRKKLEVYNVQLLCKGCSRYVYPSPMIISMGDAIEAYELTLGKQALLNDLVNIFEPCEKDEYATIEEQCRYYEEWVMSKKS